MQYILGALFADIDDLLKNGLLLLAKEEGRKSGEQ